MIKRLGILFMVVSHFSMASLVSADNAPGYPSREADLDALPGFQTPPPGYGEVPFWWWSGEDLDVDRLLNQVHALHEKGISGVQVNYSHLDTPGWVSDAKDPAIFSEAWWKVYSRVSEECGKLGMGIGLSTYTIDWPNGAHNLFYKLFYSKPELHAQELVAEKRVRFTGGETKALPCGDTVFAARAYALKEGVLQRGGLDLSAKISEGRLEWTAPAGAWEVWTFAAKAKKGSLNPLRAGSGDTVIKGFYQEFENRNPGKTSKGLNYFFNDELQVGLGKFAWNPDFADEFKKRKGYDLLELLPAMWEDMGDVTPKLRIDYADVRMSLMEERYFEPIYNWHESRGIIYGCDNHGRGLDPHAYGDYFRASRWYSAPGHDTPGGHADVIKGKVSSSIANLYQRPRVWLEGYHSLGWGATPERLMFATRENYLFGCTLLNLHGLYYSTYGSHWEWAPPCYHFHMPYWDHMDKFLKYFDRLSYLMSQGHHVSDVAVIYPVTPYEAEMNPEKAREISFHTGTKLMDAGINFDFIDHQSIARARVKGDRLEVENAKASYRVLVLPNMDALRWSTIEKAVAFAKAGGLVLSVGDLPTASDRAGRNDEELAQSLDQALKPVHRFKGVGAAIDFIRSAFTPDVRGLKATVRALHRKVGPRDVYLVMDAEAGAVVEFRAKGAAELWDPWTGNTRPLQVVKQTATGTQVELPLEKYEAQVVVFTPGQEHENPAESDQRLVREIVLEEDWRVTFEPTMNNQYGDFRLPVTEANKMIGVEARRFAWARETAELAERAMQADLDDSDWATQLHGYGPQMYLLGPVPESIDPAAVDASLSQLERIDPSVAVEVEGKSYFWRPYAFSWRYGKEGDPGHQGFHGLKGTISEHFIRLGEASVPRNGIMMLAAEEHSRYYLWSSATLDAPVDAVIKVSDAAAVSHPNTTPVIAPKAIYLNGDLVEDYSQPLCLNAGANPLLIRFDDWSQGHVVLRKADIPVPEETQPLAMPWYKDPGVIPFDLYAGDVEAEWFRFVSAPGTTAIRLKTESQAPVQVWYNGEPMVDKGAGRFEARNPAAHSVPVALRVVPSSGMSGGALIPEPISIETSGQGQMALGDWSTLGVLNNYSGGVRYRTSVSLKPEELSGKLVLDLGRVIATAEVWVNGEPVGVCVAPPWKLDISGKVRSGENEVEVLVYNTLANHYQTIPSLYRGDPASGLLGPVRLKVFED